MDMKHGKGTARRLISVLLALVMCFGMLSGTAFAAEYEDDGTCEAGHFRISVMKAGRSGAEDGGTGQADEAVMPPTPVFGGNADEVNVVAMCANYYSNYVRGYFYPDYVPAGNLSGYVDGYHLGDVMPCDWREGYDWFCPLVIDIAWWTQAYNETVSVRHVFSRCYAGTNIRSISQVPMNRLGLYWDGGSWVFPGKNLVVAMSESLAEAEYTVRHEYYGPDGALAGSRESTATGRTGDKFSLGGIGDLFEYGGRKYKRVSGTPDPFVLCDDVTANVATFRYEPAYTVAYTDGLSGTVFGDQTYGNLVAGDPVPAFVGRPKRDGYRFTGWSPTVGGTVDGEHADDGHRIVYTAQWARDVTFTVTYTDGVVGETVFPDQAYEGCPVGERTPAFVGTPERDGCTFMGWAPAVNPVVAEDDADDDGSITYTATWQRRLITGIEKKLVKNRGGVPDGVAVDGITYPDANGRVSFGTGGSVTLLYGITVTGDAGRTYRLTDDGAVYVGGDPMEGEIPEGGRIVAYVARTFRIGDINGQGKLENTATVVPGKGIDSSTSSTETTPVVTRTFKVIYYNESGASWMPVEDSANAGFLDMPEWQMDEGVTENPHTMTIPDQVPTRAGYVFDHWQWGGDGDAAFAPGDMITLTADPETLTEVAADLYAVWEESGFELPKTGGTGTAPYIVLGSAMALPSGLLLAGRKKRR